MGKDWSRPRQWLFTLHIGFFNRLFKHLSDPLFRCNHSVKRAARCRGICGTAPLVGVRVRLSPV
jgi:hypothetical protein